MSNLTVVTGLFDIGREALEGNFKRSFDLYKGWFSDILQTLDVPMIVYCEESLNAFIYEHRKDKPIIIINLSLDDIRKFPYYAKIQQLRTSETWRSSSSWLPWSPQASLELYNPLIMSKQLFLDACVDLNPFATNYFVWLDAGVANTTSMELLKGDLGGRLIPYLDKMLYLAFEYRGYEAHGFLQEGMDRIAEATTERLVRATLFGGSREIIKTITPLYDDLLKQSLDCDLMGTEENILTLVSYRYPEFVNLHWIEHGFIRHFLERIR